MIVIALLIILGIFLYFLFRKDNNDSMPNNESKYSKSGNWMDFDPGVDENKVGDPKYPNAGTDSVMKHEFLDNLNKKDSN